MTVKELISKLQEMPQDMEVYDYGSFERERDIDVFIDEMDVDGTEDETKLVVFI